MKLFLSGFVLVMLTVSCSKRANQVVYDMIHERERQECLKQGRDDCIRVESYDKYKKQREEEMKSHETYEPFQKLN